MNVWHKIDTLDRRWIYLLLALIMIIPLVKPLGLPIDITPETQKVYDTMNNLPSGSVVLISFDFDPSAIPELLPMGRAAIIHAFKRDYKVLLFGNWTQGPMLAQDLAEPIAKQMGKEYGKDWVNLGYKPGGSVTIRRMVDDLWDAAGNVDLKGTSLAGLPMMQKVRKLTDVGAVFSCTVGSGGMEFWLQYLGQPNGVPITGGAVSVMVPGYMPYVKSGQFKGILMGLRGAAEYELLVKAPGKAVAGMDAQSASHALVILLIILGNIGFWMQRRATAAHA